MIDATHPYAQVVTANIRKACEKYPAHLPAALPAKRKCKDDGRMIAKAVKTALSM